MFNAGATACCEVPLPRLGCHLYDPLGGQGYRLQHILVDRLPRRLEVDVALICNDTEHSEQLDPLDAVALNERWMVVFAVLEAVQVNMTKMSAVEVNLPPLSEQRSIVAILTERMAAAERGCEALQEELDTINKLPAALLRRAFRGEL